MTEPFVHIDNLSLNYRKNVVWSALSWNIYKGEQWLLRGNSGSGKTSLSKVIAGLMQCSGTIKVQYNTAENSAAKVLYVAQWFPFKNKQGVSNFYYQQRYNSSEAEASITVWEELYTYGKKAGRNENDTLAVLASLDLLHRKDADLIQLSSGEHKKLQLSKALLLQPQLLILDNPYTGLDVQTRKNLNDLIDSACAQGMQLILISNDGNEPSCISHYATLSKGTLYTSVEDEADQMDTENYVPFAIPSFLTMPETEETELLKVNNVHVKYGDKTILNNINWTVKTGEKWLLQGPNGSGKSTLLSLLTGDNPQAYANEIYLFGKRRGSGESIWDIKRNIGFISPELQWYFEPSATVFQTIASGFFDTTGLFRTLSALQSEKVKQLLQVFGLSAEEHTLLTQLPIGKQRLALLARAIIKNPPLLILDEPCQGLDQQQTRLFNQLIDTLCTANRTLIYVGHFENRLPECIGKRLSLHNGVATHVDVILEQEINT
jgi:molybdate transport system ATP-binding protein